MVVGVNYDVCPCCAALAAALELAAAEADEVPSGVEVEAHHEKHDREKDDYRAQHYFAA